MFEQRHILAFFGQNCYNECMELMIPCASGLEAIVKRQLAQLGYPHAPAENGRLNLTGDWSDVARLNVFLRSGERVLIKLLSFHAETFDELFDGVYGIPWENWLDLHSLVLIDGKSVKSKLGAIKASGGVVKKAIMRRLCEKLHSRSPRLEEDGARSIVGVSIFCDEVTVTLDTSGDGLHKRGYRSLAYTAPLKETTAAALIDMTYYNADKPFADLFCGSGTLPIEAAMRSLHIAPGMHRSFDFTAWKCAPRQVLENALTEAKDAVSLRPLSVLARDISKDAVSIAQYHAKRAGVHKFIRFETGDMRTFRSQERYGILLSNPPYGERLSDKESVKTLYRDLGKVYSSLSDWSAYLLTGLPEADRYFGKRADKKKKIWNANIECGFYSFLGAPPPKEPRRTQEIL